MITLETKPKAIVGKPTAEWMQEIHTQHGDDQPYYGGLSLCLKFIRIGETVLSAPLIWTTDDRTRWAPVTTHAEIATAAEVDLERVADAGFFLLQLAKNELAIYGSRTIPRDVDEAERSHTLELMRDIVSNTYSVESLT